MNIIHQLYYSQYYELKQKGKAAAARKTANTLVTVAFLTHFFVLMTLLVMLFPDLGDAISDFNKDVFGRRNGRLAGVVFAGIPMSLIYMVVIKTIGSESNYEGIITEGQLLSEDQQRATIKSGLIYFISSLISIIIPILYLAL